MVSFGRRACRADRVDRTISRGCVCRSFPCSGSTCLPSCRVSRRPHRCKRACQPALGRPTGTFGSNEKRLPARGKALDGDRQETGLTLAKLTGVCGYMPKRPGWRADAGMELEPENCSDDAKILKIFVNAQEAPLLKACASAQRKETRNQSGSRCYVETKRSSRACGPCSERGICSSLLHEHRLGQFPSRRQPAISCSRPTGLHPGAGCALHPTPERPRVQRDPVCDPG